MSYFEYDCKKCGNNHWTGKTITRITPSILEDKKRKEYFECGNCNYKWYCSE